jgi:hypothetical protein
LFLSAPPIARGEVLSTFARVAYDVILPAGICTRRA